MTPTEPQLARLSAYAELFPTLTLQTDGAFPHISSENTRARALETVALFPRVDLDLLRVSGAERGKFLQGLLTADLTKSPAGPPTGHGTGAAMLDVRGKMQSDMRLYQRADDFLIELPWGKGPEMTALLDRYLIRMKAKLHEESAQWLCVMVAGPLAADVLANALGVGVTLPSNIWHGVEGVIAGVGVSVVASDWLGRESVGGFHVWIKQPGWSAVWSALQAGAAAMGGGVIDTQTFESARVKAGVPRFGVDMDADTIPLEAGLMHLISFTKGCYLGQEIIARVDSRGAVAKHLVRFRVRGVVKVGDVVAVGDKALGEITTVAQVDGELWAMGWTRRGFEAAGTEVRIGEEASGEVIG